MTATVLPKAGFSPARFSWARVGAVLVKEFIQMRRDRLTFAMMVGIPILQLVLFGYAINTDPKHLPTAALVHDHSRFSRAIVAAMENSDYFDVSRVIDSEAEARRLLTTGEVAFVVTIPADFARDLMRGDRPRLLVQADATDPSATSNALAAMEQLQTRALTRELTGALAPLMPGDGPVELVLHRLYNPEGITAYNIVPGLIGVILTMSTTLMTALALTREVERGTMENLLAMPVRPVEVMLGKIGPYIAIGFFQVAIILLAARFLFHVPILGSVWLLYLVLFVFIAANVSLGYTFSTLARTQMQAMQMTFFFFLPSILLSGFMFPFAGMPGWAQVFGEILPLTHFMRMARGIILKGNGAAEILPELWPLVAFLLAVGTFAVLRYRRTLD